MGVFLTGSTGFTEIPDFACPPAEKAGQAVKGGGITDCRFIKNTNKSMVAE
jgi:hypothetical protein